MADKLGKVRRLHRKSVKLPSLKAIVENERSIAPQSLACVQTSPISFVATKEIGDVCTQTTQSPVGRLYYGGGSNLPPPPLPNIQTSVNLLNFAKLYLRSLNTYHFQIWH